MRLWKAMKKESAQAGKDRREAFRVEDVLLLVCRKIDPGLPHLGARMLPGFSEDYLLPDSTSEPPYESISPHLWNLLLQINHKLGVIIDKLNLAQEGVTKAEPTAISLSSSGAKFTTREECIAGDVLEMKILLPLDPPSWIVIQGKVLRVTEKEPGQKDVAVQFFDMEEPVLETINKYCLRWQREFIRKRKSIS